MSEEKETDFSKFLAANFEKDRKEFEDACKSLRAPIPMRRRLLPMRAQ